MLPLALSLRLLAAVLPLDTEASLWAERVGACLSAEASSVWAAKSDLLAFACGAGGRRLVVMANGDGVPQDVVRVSAEPLVPVYASNGDVAAVPSLLLTLYDSGGVRYSNRIPPRTVVVFRPAAERDVRPGRVDE